jgi:hypothetical protein
MKDGRVAGGHPLMEFLGYTIAFVILGWVGLMVLFSMADAFCSLDSVGHAPPTCRNCLRRAPENHVFCARKACVAARQEIAERKAERQKEWDRLKADLERSERRRERRALARKESRTLARTARSAQRSAASRREPLAGVFSSVMGAPPRDAGRLAAATETLPDVARQAYRDLLARPTPGDIRRDAWFGLAETALAAGDWRRHDRSTTR